MFPFDVLATTNNIYNDFMCLLTAYCIDYLRLTIQQHTGCIVYRPMLLRLAHSRLDVP